jgi:anti-anti-sigma regulatory factor
MLRITRTENGELVFKLSGRIETENIAELKSLLRAETNGRRILLDLSDLILVDQDVVSFLRHCESDGIELKNCPPYIRAWIAQEAKQA